MKLHPDNAADVIALYQRDIAARDAEIMRQQEHLKAVRSKIEQAWQRVQVALSEERVMTDEAREPFTIGELFTIKQPEPPTALTICPGGKMMVTVHMDGRLEYGEDYNPDDAARIFWNAMRCHMPSGSNPALGSYTSEELINELAQRSPDIREAGEEWFKKAKLVLPLSLGWCSHCGCGNDARGYAHLPSCPDHPLRKALPRET